jgi:hypothetical protein
VRGERGGTPGGSGLLVAGGKQLVEFGIGKDETAAVFGVSEQEAERHSS